MNERKWKCKDLKGRCEWKCEGEGWKCEGESGNGKGRSGNVKGRSGNVNGRRRGGENGFQGVKMVTKM